MTEHASTRRSPLDPAVPALAAVAEAAWISIVAALAQALIGERQVLGVAGLVPFVAFGIVAARVGAKRWGDRWPAIAVGATLVTAALGWAASAAVREALAAGDVSGALGEHIGGWLAGLATLRGFAHATVARSEATFEGLLTVGLPALAGVAIVGGAMSQPQRSWFVEDALAGAVVFLGSSTLGLSIARMSTLGVAAGLDWRRNRPWLAILIGLVVGIAALALPAAFVVGPAVQVIVGVLTIPLLVAGIVAGFGYTSWRTLLAILVGGGLLILAFALGGDILDTAPTPESEEVAAGGAANQAVVGAAAGGIGLLIVIVVILVLARLWIREIRAPVDSDVPEERTIDRPILERGLVPRPRPDGRRRRLDPTDAAAAYVALVESLAGRSAVARYVGETPAEHARRVRRAGHGGLALDLLAADYELTRFGGRRLSAAETRRAIARWSRLRRSLAP